MFVGDHWAFPNILMRFVLTKIILPFYEEQTSVYDSFFYIAMTNFMKIDLNILVVNCHMGVQSVNRYLGVFENQILA